MLRDLGNSSKVRLLIGVVGIAVASYVLYAERVQLTGAIGIISNVNPLFILGGLLLEFVSNVGYASMGYWLVFEPPQYSSLWYFLLLTLVALAIANSIPFGTGFSAVWLYDRLKRFGVPKSRAVAGIVGSNLMGIATLVVLFAAAVVVSPQTKSVLSTVDIVYVLAVGLLAVLGMLFMDRVIGGASRLVGKLFKRTAWALAQMQRYSREVLALSAGGGVLNWLADFSVLVVSLQAVHAHVSLVGVASAYLLGSFASTLPLTPGGLGVVEGSVTVSLVAFGGSPAKMLAAVILYRIASFWVWIPIGWAAYFGLGG